LSEPIITKDDITWWAEKQPSQPMKFILVIVAIVALLGGAVQPVVAADVTAAVDVNSAYVWRGQTFNDGMVAQPSVDVASGGFGFNVWGNIDIDDYYSTLGLGWEYGITEQLSLGLGGSIAYAGEEYCADDSAGLYDYNLLVEPPTQKSPLYALCMQRAFLWAYKGTGFIKNVTCCGMLYLRAQEKRMLWAVIEA